MDPNSNAPRVSTILRSKKQGSLVKLGTHDHLLNLNLDYTGTSSIDMVPQIVDPQHSPSSHPDSYDSKVDYVTRAKDGQLMLNNSVSQLKDICFSTNMLKQELKKVHSKKLSHKSDCLRFRRSNQALQKNLECPYEECSKHYASRSSLKLHMKNCHQLTDPKKESQKSKLSSLLYKCHVHSARLDPSTVIAQKKPDSIQTVSTDECSIKISGDSSNSGLEIQNERIGKDIASSLLQKRDFDFFNDASTRATPIKTLSHPCLQELPMSSLSCCPKDNKENSISEILQLSQQHRAVNHIFVATEKEYLGCLSDALETNSFDDFLINDNPFNDIDENQNFLKEQSIMSGYEENFDLDLCDQNSTWQSQQTSHNFLRTCFTKDAQLTEDSPRMLKLKRSVTLPQMPLWYLKPESFPVLYYAMGIINQYGQD